MKRLMKKNHDKTTIALVIYLTDILQIQLLNSLAITEKKIYEKNKNITVI